MLNVKVEAGNLHGELCMRDEKLDGRMETGNVLVRDPRLAVIFLEAKEGSEGSS